MGRNDVEVGDMSQKESKTALRSQVHSSFHPSAPSDQLHSYDSDTGPFILHSSAPSGLLHIDVSQDLETGERS